ncbi:hypothetical protein [Sphingomonas sp. 1P08PE]|uniref:hypothetical protein n=1 Tax=Sphingomonas sp. 1P08PE TaxID=554122 RepID=UPI00399F9D4A
MPQVQAYVGNLPEGRRGIEFVTEVPPSPGTPPHEARWRAGHSGVKISDDEEFAIITIVVIKSTQG